MWFNITKPKEGNNYEKVLRNHAPACLAEVSEK